MLNFLKKREVRYNREEPIHFIGESGTTCVGLSKNISKEALLLVSESRCPIQENEEGEIVLNYKGEIHVFPCSVVRVNKYSLEKYYVALKFDCQEAIDLFSSIIVRGTKCESCGSAENLEQCPECKGINTICTACHTQYAACKSCRTDTLKQRSRETK